MASLSLLLRLPLATAVILLLFLSATATARPCRSFIISSYSVRNPSSNTFTTITEIRSLTPLRIADLNNNRQPSFQIIDDTLFDPLPRRHVSGSSNNNLQLDPRASLPRASLGFSTADYAFASLRDRTKDILSVVIALLFGVGCGALTAATMYLVWSVFAGRRGYRSSAYDDFSSSDDDSEIESPKKMGYVKIPAAEVAAAAPPAAPPAAAAPAVKDSQFAEGGDRTEDRTVVIFRLLAALLCYLGYSIGPAIIMYFVWSAYVSRRGSHSTAYDDLSSSGDDMKIESSKKMGYLKIPVVEVVAATPAVPSAAQDSV